MTRPCKFTFSTNLSQRTDAAHSVEVQSFYFERSINRMGIKSLVHQRGGDILKLAAYQTLIVPFTQNFPVKHAKSRGQKKKFKSCRFIGICYSIRNLLPPDKGERELLHSMIVQFKGPDRVCSQDDLLPELNWASNIPTRSSGTHLRWILDRKSIGSKGFFNMDKWEVRSHATTNSISAPQPRSVHLM